MKAVGSPMDQQNSIDFKIERLPKELQDTFRTLYANGHTSADVLATGEIHHGDARDLLPKIAACPGGCRAKQTFPSHA